MNMTRNTHTRIRHLALVLVLAATFLAGSTTAASAITRAEVLSRAQRRVDAPVPYSQSKYYAGYRTDCSGYVSMCWGTGTSYSTRSFYLVTTPIKRADLMPGDAMLKKGYHIRLFYGWLDAAKTEYVAYESARVDGRSIVAGVRIHSYAEDIASGYVPVRYDRITNGATTTNLLRNPSFDTWSRSWAVGVDQPVWWHVDGAYGQLIATRRKNTYYSGRNSLQLVNSSATRSSVTGLSQTTSATAAVKYRLSAYAKMACDPSTLEMRLAFLGPFGDTLSQTSAPADRYGIDATSYKNMSFIASSPPGAVSALVSFRLAGGTSADASGNIVPGTAVLLDHITLERPRMSVGMNTSPSSFYRTKRISLIGSVSPTASIGTTATVYVKRPGTTTWKRIASTEVTASGSSAVWRSAYNISSTMPRGSYYFKTVVPGADGWASGTSRTARVLKR